MRRLLALALVGLVAVAASGCSGVDAQEAQNLLDQSTTAMAKVRSLNFAIRMWTEGAPEGENFTVLMRGGGYQRGRHAGESYATIDSENLPELGRMTVVVRRNALYVKAGGRWSRAPVPTGQAAANPLSGFDLTRYVTDVRVDNGVVVGGEPMDKITGVIDTKAALNGLMSLGGTGSSDLGSAADILGDIRAVLYVSRTTHLPMRTLVDMPIEFIGEKVVMHMDIVITGIDKRVPVPSVG
jgi:hypothetical protein